MSANGPGVLMDAAATPLFIAYEDDNNVDAQADPYGFFYYDLHKIWSTMGRVDQQTVPVMRSGFWEEGSPHTGYTAGSIQRFNGSTGLFEGVEFWNSLTAYNLWINNLANDYVMFSVLAPFSGIMLHLGAALASQPVFTTEVLTNATGAGTWAAVILGSKVADFTQAGGYKNQRHEWTKPTLWPSLVFGSFAEARYHMRLKLTTPAAASPQANVAYKDWLYGHFKHWYSQYHIQKGQTSVSSVPTTLKDEGNFAIRFRDGFGFTTGGNVTQFVQLGELDAGANRTAVRKPWAVMSAKGFMKPVNLYGGAVLATPPNISNFQSTAHQYMGNGTNGKLVGCLLSGGNRYTLGRNVGEEMKQISDVRIVKDPLATGAPAVAGFRMVGVGSDPIVDRLGMDNHVGGSSLNIFTTTATTVLLIGPEFGHDDVTQGQLFRSVSTATRWDVVTPKWGGPNKRFAFFSAAAGPFCREWWYLNFYLGNQALTSPLAGIRIEAYDDLNRLQLTGVTDANGRMFSYTNLLGGVGPGQKIGQNIFCVAEGDGVGFETVDIDTAVRIEINPTGAAEYNSAYESRTMRSKFPRAYEGDPTLGYAEHSWQRMNWLFSLGLQLARPGILTGDIPVEAPLVERAIVTLPVVT